MIHPADETKDCPSCAETIKAKASRCRYCGHDFTRPPAGTADDSSSPGSNDEKPNRRMISGLTVLAIAVVIYCAVNPPEFLQPRPAGPFALGEVEKDFEADTASAFAKFGHGPILVQAVVSSVHADRLTLQTINILDVQAYFSGTPSGYEGERVTLRCQTLEAEEYMTGAKPLLRGCRRT